MSDRRAFLRAIATGSGVALAGCSGIIDPGESSTDDSGGSGDNTGTEPRTPTAHRASGTPVGTDGTATTGNGTAGNRTSASGTGDSDLAYYSPGSDLDRYDELVRTRKRAALETLLGVPDVGTAVTEAVSSTAYHRILDGVDFIEILAPHTMEITPKEHGPAADDGDPTYELYEPDTFEIAPVYDVDYDDIHRIRGLIDRETGALRRLHVRTDTDRFDNGNDGTRTYRWDYREKGIDLGPARTALENDEVRGILRDKNWYVAASSQSTYAGYSEDYPIGSLSQAWFNWNGRGSEHVAVHTVLDQDADEVFGVYPPEQQTPQPLSNVVRGAEGTSLDGVTRGPITPPGKKELTAEWVDENTTEDDEPFPSDAQGTVERHDWHVEWHNSFHEAYRISASFRGKPVFGPSTLVPYMFSDYQPFGTVAPGVPKGEQINHHFWDPLGVTGPGVVERHEFEDGFRLRGTFHSGSSDRWEWRFGQNYGPYRYIVDWSFYDDGRAIQTVRFPTTGYRTTNGFPKYTFHVAVEPGFETASASAFDGSSWSSVGTETGFERSATPKLRVENADGPERIVFEQPGERSLVLQYDPDLVEYENNGPGLDRKLDDNQEYLQFENYLRDRSIDGERLQIRTLSGQKTEEGPYATVDPFMFRFVLRAENY